MLPARYLAAVTVGTVCTLSALFIPTDSMMYHREAISINSEWWRLLTAHLSHLNAVHLQMNLAGLVLTELLFPLRNMRWQAQLVVWLALALAVSGWIWWITPDVLWYSGLSGVLHGRLLLGCLLRWLERRDWPDAVIALLLLAKVSWEAVHGGEHVSSGLINAPVLTESHLAGALAGLVLLPVIISSQKLLMRLQRDQRL